MLVRTAGGNYGMWTKVGQEGQKQDGGGLESRVGTPRRRPAAEREESGELRLPSFGLVLNLSAGMTISAKFLPTEKIQWFIENKTARLRCPLVRLFKKDI